MNDNHDRSSASVADRLLDLRTRRDLQIVPVWLLGQRWYVVKDPIALKYTRLRHDERRLLDWLDQPQSLRSLQLEYQRMYAPRRVTLADLQRLLDRFQLFQLVTTSRAGIGRQLQQAARRTRQQAWIERLQNLWFVKFPGIDPEPWLGPLDCMLGWIFNPLTIAVVLCLWIITLSACVFRATDVLAKIPEMNVLFSGNNLALLVGAVSLTKVCHELGHALACKHYGGECHQIGPLWMVCAPALYCDTSDAWLLPYRWQRVMVGAAGMYVEGIVAMIAAWIWWSTDTGAWHYLSLQIMLVCSLSTLLVNGNPLLRYDGYFILADACGIPNLAEESRRVLVSDLRQWFLREETRPSTTSPWPTFLRCYAVAAWIYRVVLFGGILVLLYHWLAPRGLALVPLLLLVSWGSGLLLGPVRAVKQQGAGAIPWFRLRWLQLGLFVAALCGLSATLVGLPVRHMVETRGVLEPRDWVGVYATVGGTLDKVLVSPGQTVSQGETLAILQAPDLELAFEKARSRLDAKAQEVAELRSRQATTEAAEELPAALAMLEELEQGLERAQARLDALRLVASQDGNVVSPLRRQAVPSRERLETWTGLPFDAENLGAYLPPGTLVCGLGDPRAWNAIVVVRESERGWIQVGQPASIICNCQPLQLLAGKVAHVSLQAISEIPDRLWAQQVLPVDPHDPEGRQPLEPSYLVTIQLDPTSQALHTGTIVRAKIEVERHTLGLRLIHEALRTLRWFH